MKSPNTAKVQGLQKETQHQHSAYFLSNAPDWRHDSRAWAQFVEKTYAAANERFPAFLHDAASKPMTCALCGHTRRWGKGELLPVPYLPKSPELLPSVMLSVCAPCVRRADVETVASVGDGIARTVKDERGHT